MDMWKRNNVLQILPLLLITLIAINSILLVYSSSRNYEYVGIGRRENIPDNLPWYPILVFGDNRPDRSGEIVYNQVTYHIRDEMVEINPIAVIGTGDHVWNGYVDQIRHFMKTFEEVPNVWVVAGNHEWNNKPYIDDSNREGIEYWRQHVSPDLYYKDDIPGWRIVFLNLRYGYIDWNNMEKWIKNNGFDTNRKLIVVFHEPVYPDREASKSIRKVQDKLIPLLDQYKPSIVLQGHIHCYDEGFKGSTLYIITGGGGAPKCRRYPYHYLLLILYPNGDYYHLPISATDGEINIYSRTLEDDNTVMFKFTVKMTKEDIYGYRIDDLPVRISFKIGDEAYNLVYMAPYGYSTTTITYYRTNNSLIVHLDEDVEIGNNPPYIYTYDGEVWVFTNKTMKIQLSPPISTTSPTNTSPSSTSRTSEPETQTTTTTFTSITAGTGASSIRNQTRRNNDSTISGGDVDESIGVILYSAIGVLILVISIEAYILVKKKS